jgi:hypothetical protein
LEAELALKAAELRDKKDTEYLKLQNRKAEAYLEVLEAKEKLMSETDARVTGATA